MSAEPKKKTGRLTFKGDESFGASSKKSKKKKKKRQLEAENEDDPGDDITGAPPAWMFAETFEDVMGPVLLVSPGNLAVSTDAHFQLFFSPIEAEGRNVEPRQVTQVFVATLQPGSSTKLRLKSCFDRHLGTDPIGLVVCDSEAAGLAHEWEVVPVPSSADNTDSKEFALKSSFGKYLSVGITIAPPKDSEEYEEEDDKTSESMPIKTLKLRCDSVSIGSQETFKILCQASNAASRRSGKKAKKDRAGSDLVTLEAEGLKKAHGHSLGRVEYGQNLGSGLAQAQREGRLHETLLDKRAKMKRDKVFSTSVSLVGVQT